MENDDKIDVRLWRKQPCSTGGEQFEIVVDEMPVKEVMAKLQQQLRDCIVHETGKTWKNRMRTIDVYTFDDKTILVCTDFSAMMDLRPIKTKCSHVDRHAVVAIFYVFTNPRWVVTETGETVRVSDCDVWHVFGDTLNKNTKNDHVFHNAALNHVLKHYTRDGNLPTPSSRVRVWTDNCPTQYRCRQNFFALSKIPNDFELIELAEHCFAQVSSFKGPWDAAGKVVKYYIRKLEAEEKERVEDAFHCYLHADTYFKNNLPDGIDWIARENAGCKTLLDKTPYNAVRRMAVYATEKKEEYERLKDVHNVVFVDRTASEDTTVYTDCNTSNHFYANGTETAQGIQLKAKDEFCRCVSCRGGNEADCNYKDTTGEEKVWTKKSKQEMESAREMQQQQALEGALTLVEPLIANGTLLPFTRHTDATLKAILRIMDKKAKRQDGRTGAPLKGDRLAALAEETEQSVKDKVQARRAELTIHQT
jgi:hypothetical protein